VILFAADCATKLAAVEELSPPYVPHEVAGDVVRLTLAYNPNAALGMTVGDNDRATFTFLAVVALGVLAAMYRRTPGPARAQAIALALITGGALGNLVDRVRSPRGVVDFIDIGVGSLRFWTFNIADVGVTAGALLLALLLWRSAQTDEGEGVEAVKEGMAVPPTA
jgi:signal peptidase II